MKMDCNQMGKEPEMSKEIKANKNYYLKKNQRYGKYMKKKKQDNQKAQEHTQDSRNIERETPTEEKTVNKNHYRDTEPPSKPEVAVSSPEGQFSHQVTQSSKKEKLSNKNPLISSSETTPAKEEAYESQPQLGFKSKPGPQDP